jgi:hypothetical protein
MAKYSDTVSAGLLEATGTIVGEMVRLTPNANEASQVATAEIQHVMKLLAEALEKIKG